VGEPVLTVPANRKVRPAGLGIFRWPRHVRLTSLGLVFLLTGHTAALAFEWNIYLDAALTVAALLLLLVFSEKSRQPAATQRQPISPFAVAAVLAVAVSTLFNASIPTAARLAVLAAFYMVLPLAVVSFRQASILAGLLLYCMVEVALVVVRFHEFNPNAAAHRITVALCVAGFCVRPRWLRYVSLTLAISVAIACHSRAALGAMVLAFAYVQLAAAKPFSFLRKQPILVLSVLAMAGFFVRREAMNYLTHDAPQAVQEFFADKKQRDLREDPFDRSQMWRAGIEAIRKRPLVGLGLGNEHEATGKLRAHNAYLKLAIECGVPAAAVVVVFFLAMLQQSFAVLTRPHIAAMAEATCFCLVYLFIYGFFESSGLFSLGTPTNLIAYCGFCWLRVNKTSENTD